MLNVRAALKAAFSETEDMYSRMALLNLMATSRPSCAPLSWRTYGESSKAVSAFVAALEPRPEDVTVKASRLAPDVVDFRWNAAGLYGGLRGAMSDAGEPDSWIVNAMRNVASGLEIDWDSVPGPVETDESADRPKARFATRPEERTRTMLNRLLDLVAGIPADERIKGLSDETENRLRVLAASSRDAPSELQPNELHQTVPGLWLIEAACRLLDPSPDDPERALFGRLVREDAGFTQSAVRYVKRTDTIPGFNMMLSGCLTQDMHNPCVSRNTSRYGADVAHPLRGYFQQWQSETERVDLSDKDAMLVFTTAPLGPSDDIAERARATAAATDRKRFWKYVESLYSRFFGVPAAIEPHARLAIGTGVAAWTNHAGLWSPTLSDQLDVENSVCATFAAVLVPDEGSLTPEWRDGMRRMRQVPPVTLVPEGAEIPADSYIPDHASWRDIPMLWHSLVHHGTIPRVEPNPYRYGEASPSHARTALARMRSRASALAASREAVEAESTVSGNPDLMMSVGRGGPVSTVSSTIMSVVAKSVRESLHPATALAPRTGNRTGRDASVVVPAVYTFTGSAECANMVANGSLPYGPALESWLGECVASSLAVPESRTGCSTLMMVVETNVAITSVDLDNLRPLLVDRLWSVIGVGCTSADAAGCRVRPSGNENRGAVARALRDRMVHDEAYGVSILAEVGMVMDFRPDRFGRLHVCVAVTGSAMDTAMARFRFRCGLPVHEAEEAARNGFESGPGPSTGIVVDDGAANMLERVVAAMRCTANADTPGSIMPYGWSGPHSTWPLFGYGPFVTRLHYADDRRCFSRGEYLAGSALNMASVLA